MNRRDPRYADLKVRLEAFLMDQFRAAFRLNGILEIVEQCSVLGAAACERLLRI